MNIPANLRYTSSHEWIRKELDGTLTIGITDHAQAALGDLVFIELPKAGRKLGAGEACAVVESVKAASDVYAPVAGTVVGRQRRGAEGAGEGERRRLRRLALPPAARRMPRRSTPCSMRAATSP